MSHGIPELLLVFLIVAGAATVKGATGFGFPLISVPLLAIFMTPRVAVPVVAIPTMLSNVMMFSRGGVGGTIGPYLIMLAALVVGTVGGALVITSLDPRLLSVLVGSVTLLYVVATAFRLTLRISPQTGRRAGPVLGLIAGVLGGATGIFAPLVASYLHMLRLAKREFVFWITVMFFVSNVAQIASYSHLGLYGGPVLRTALFACLPMVLGTLAGIRIQNWLRPEVFNRVVLVIVFLASLNLLARGVLG
jgi:uncharacterized membrane protein YfcA